MSTTSSENKRSKKDSTQINGEDEDEKTILGFDPSIFWTGIISALVVIILWVLTIIIFNNWDSTKRGTFGDMFGSTNALFSGLAFAGLIFTILLQRKELELQRKELKDTRAEFKQQNKTISYQRFETIYYKLLELNREMLRNLEYLPQIHLYTGRNQHVVMNKVVNGATVLGLINGNIRDYNGHDIDQMYQNGVRDFHCPLDSYLGSLFNLMEIVDNHFFVNVKIENSEEDVTNHQFRMFYMRILVNLLDINELDFLFYYCLTSNKYSFMKAFLEKYSFFQYLDRNDFPPAWTEKYEEHAWQRTNPVQYLSEKGLL